MRFKIVGLIFVSLLLWGCSGTLVTPSLIRALIIADGKQVAVELPPGSNVEYALKTAGITLGSLDRIEPDLSALLSNDDQIRITRVREEFTVEQEVIPFEQQRVQTESLPEQKTLIAQEGENGLREITYQHIYEDGVEISQKRVNDGVIIKEPVPEIIMIGVQTAIAPFAIPGRLAYLLGGNAWVMEDTTAKRRPAVTTGDLDGRIFTLSPDGKWLLFTRRSNVENEINTLWAANVDQTAEKWVDLKISNIVHFAGWKPKSSRNDFAFSTVEARPTAPGWQANNDLNLVSFSSTSWISKWKTLIDSNSGGVYGWWGTSFGWSPSGNQLAYLRPDSVGLVDLESGILQPLLDILPFQTHRDWAWIPAVSWAPDDNTLITVDHRPSGGTVSPEESQLFDLVALPLPQGKPIHLALESGMFTYPVASPLLGEGIGDQYQIVYLQAIFPNQSETSRYRLWITEQDGSNKRQLFPTEGETGLDPQLVVWSPSPMPDSNEYSIAVLYQGNIWIIEPTAQQIPDIRARQVTGDGLVSRISWSSVR